jgi:hypothetical protein
MGRSAAAKRLQNEKEAKLRSWKTDAGFHGVTQAIHHEIRAVAEHLKIVTDQELHGFETRTR